MARNFSPQGSPPRINKARPAGRARRAPGGGPRRGKGGKAARSPGGARGEPGPGGRADGGRPRSGRSRRRPKTAAREGRAAKRGGRRRARGSSAARSPQPAQTDTRRRTGDPGGDARRAGAGAPPADREPRRSGAGGKGRGGPGRPQQRGAAAGRRGRKPPAKPRPRRFLFCPGRCARTGAARAPGFMPGLRARPAAVAAAAPLNARGLRGRWSGRAAARLGLHSSEIVSTFSEGARLSF